MNDEETSASHTDERWGSEEWARRVIGQSGEIDMIRLALGGVAPTGDAMFAMAADTMTGFGLNSSRFLFGRPEGRAAIEISSATGGWSNPIGYSSGIGYMRPAIPVASEDSSSMVWNELMTLQMTVGVLAQRLQIVEELLGEVHKMMLSLSQSYYWTPDWQAKEERADEDAAAGRSRRFESVDDLIRDLNE